MPKKKTPNILMKSQLNKDEVRTRGDLNNENMEPTRSQGRIIRERALKMEMVVRDQDA